MVTTLMGAQTVNWAAGVLDSRQTDIALDDLNGKGIYWKNNRQLTGSSDRLGNQAQWLEGNPAEGQTVKDAAPEALTIFHLWPGHTSGGAVGKPLSPHVLHLMWEL